MDKSTSYSEYFYRKALADTAAIKKNALQYPYCPFTNFIFLYHCKKTSDPDFEKVAQKTVLYFDNPNWLQFQLNPDPSENTISQVIENYKAEPENEEILYPPSLAPFSANEGESVKIEPNEVFQSTVSDNPYKDPTPEFINEPLQEPSSELKEENKEELITPKITEDHIKTVKESAAEEQSPIEFEPLHTVDYFASLGIKIDEEFVSNDKLGIQMKSFTEWLKSMKKIHPDKLEEQNTTVEKLVQSSAEESNISTEVLTEALAEVLIKQNKKDKAIEMFSKLSLINPAKSAYFAAKIESIKSS
jgi:hypothetical protein